MSREDSSLSSARNLSNTGYQEINGVAMPGSLAVFLWLAGNFKFALKLCDLGVRLQ